MGVLTLSRKTHEQLLIGGNIIVEVREIRRSRVVLSVSAPDEVPILRAELKDEESEE